MLLGVSKRGFGSHPCLSRQRSRVRVSSSPPFLFKNLPKVLHFRAGTKRHKIGTGNRVFPSRAYVSCVFSRNKSATTASCAFRFSVVTACVYVSRVTRIVEWRSSSCMIFSNLQLCTGRSKQRRIGLTKSMPADSFCDAQFSRNRNDMVPHDLLGQERPPTLVDRTREYPAL